jgi:hypothetical protein
LQHPMMLLAEPLCCRGGGQSRKEWQETGR